MERSIWDQRKKDSHRKVLRGEENGREKWRGRGKGRGEEVAVYLRGKGNLENDATKEMNQGLSYREQGGKARGPAGYWEGQGRKEGQERCKTVRIKRTLEEITNKETSKRKREGSTRRKGFLRRKEKKENKVQSGAGNPTLKGTKSRERIE